MELLIESKRAWLFSYCLFSVIALALYFLSWDTVIGKTACILVTEMQFLMLIFFLLVIGLKWNKGCRTILMLFYVGGTVYLEINHYISRWHIIIPLSLLLIFYMLWNIGGVKNCVIACKYKVQLDKSVFESKDLYAGYKEAVGRYNERNELGFWTRVKIKKEPNWENYQFQSSGLDMFIVEDALFGITTDHWERQITEVDRINSSLGDKHKALRNNESFYEEKCAIDRIKEKTENFGGETEEFDKQRKAIDTEIGKSRKKEKKILKKRW